MIGVLIGLGVLVLFVAALVWLISWSISQAERMIDRGMDP